MQLLRISYSIRLVPRNALASIDSEFFTPYVVHTRVNRLAIAISESNQHLAGRAPPGPPGASEGFQSHQKGPSLWLSSSNLSPCVALPCPTGLPYRLCASTRALTG